MNKKEYKKLTKEPQNNKKKIIIIAIIIIILTIIILQIFIKKPIKNNKIGNNSSSQEIIENLINISSYEAEIEMTVYSNKNENKYKIKQKYEKEGDKEKSSQEIIEPNNIAGIKIVQEENKLTLENSKLSITNIIENYKYITDSCIDLSSFIKEYKKSETKNEEEKDDNIIINIIVPNANPYIKNRTLVIDKKTGNPIKMECKSENKKETVYILYNEVKLKNQEETHTKK